MSGVIAPDTDALDTLVEAALDGAGDAEAVRRVLSQLYERYHVQQRLLDRLVRISDRYQSAERERGLGYADNYQRKVRQIEKIVRISDRYQTMLHELNERLRQISTHDDLTGLPNRRHMRERLLDLAARGAGSFVIALADIDHFKVVNDTWGHAAGDVVLRQVAETLALGAGGDGANCARWGGEEFLILFNGVGSGEALTRAQDLRRAVSELPLLCADAAQVSISIGITPHHPDEPLDATLSRADSALYKAKANGRDRVVAFP